jgi:ABC-2 type transport system permease protein
MFLIPAITMRSLAEEYQQGTIELLATKPLRDRDIILGKYLAALVLVVFALIPTVLYYYSVYQLGEPVGNLDGGAIFGSYLGLFFLAAAFVAIGLFSSSLTSNQISSFVLATFLCFLLYYGFYFFSRLPVFVGRGDDLIERIGIDFHYQSISRGVLDSRDLIYFISVSVFFLICTHFVLQKRKW